MYIGPRKPRRTDSPWRVLILVVLIVGALYVLREQLSGASWTRPFDPTPSPTRSSESYFDEAEALYQEGVLDRAIDAYRGAFRADPQDNVALSRLARLLTYRQRTGEVLELYGARLQDENLGDARTLAVLGMALDWHAVHNSEDMLPVYVALEVIDEQEIQDEEWVYSVERVTDQLYRAAQKVCERALRQDPNLPEAYGYLAEALADRERYDEALVAAQTGVDLNPNVPDTQRALAFVHEKQGHYEQAIEAYQAATAAHPRLSFLHIALGKNYRAIGYRLNLEGRWDAATPYFEQAVLAFEQAIALDPGNPESYDEIGWTYGHFMGEERETKQRGVDYLEEAIAQNPEYAMAHRHLGQVYYDLRNYEEAIPALEQGLALGGLPAADVVLSHIMVGWSYYVLDRADSDVEDPCANALPHFQAAADVLVHLPQRELGLEALAEQGLDTCQ
ncbi:MAG: tetratricopeptide repeat protein [Anaerolineae bacterium]|nr:tetratricopeptide repeat protein [Anaerolineae bacterium]